MGVITVFACCIDDWLMTDWWLMSSNNNTFKGDIIHTSMGGQVHMTIAMITLVISDTWQTSGYYKG